MSPARGTDVELDSLTLTNGHANVQGGAILTGAGTTLTVVDTHRGEQLGPR